MNNLFNTMLREAIGYEPLARFANIEVTKYPPHNITKTPDDKYTILLAVAGFSKDELSVKVEDSFLKVTGSRKVTDAPEGLAVLYHGISFRDFERSWKLGEYVEVTGVKLENGLLEINLERKVPDELKAKTFDIN